MTQADCNALHLRIFTCRHALIATMRRRPGKAAPPSVNPNGAHPSAAVAAPATMAERRTSPALRR